MSETFFNSIDRINPGAVILDGDVSNDVTLTNPIPNSVVVDGIFVGSFTLRLADVNLPNSLPLGTSIRVKNILKLVTANVIVKDSANNTLGIVKSNQYATFDLVDNSTAKGEWVVTNYQSEISDLTHNITFTGPFISDINVNLKYQIIDGMVRIFIPQTISQTTSSTFITNTFALDGNLTPNSLQQGLFPNQFNGNPVFNISRFEVSTSGFFKFYGGESGSNYPITSSAGILPCVINYFLN